MTLDWAEKYRPTTLDEVIGNPSAVNSLKSWAESWERGVPKKKAAVLIGDPGIGKTSSALALAKEFGWGVVEMNASDLRNADAIRSIATSGARNETFTDSGEYVFTKSGGRKLIILDEADNIFGKEDYGGVSAIMATIKETKQPIILIVNDYYALLRKAPALERMCLKIRFSKIQKNSVVRLLKNICLNEDLSVSNQTLAALAEHSAGDLRSAINDLQSLALGKKKISEKDVTVLGYRDSSINIFKAVTGIFRATSYSRAREAAFNLNEDPEHLLLWIDENLPIEYKRPEDLAFAYNSLSKASIYLGRVRIRQHYRLWSYATDLMTAGVALAKTDPYYGYTRYQFPTWLKKMSRSRGIRTTQKSLSNKLSSSFHTSRYVAQTSIYPYFQYLFINQKDFDLSAICELELDSDEIAYILGEKSDSSIVKQLIEDSKKMDTKKKEEVTPFKDFSSTPSKDKVEKELDSELKIPDKKQKNLTDF
jgi:replication factor C large subunit